MSSSEVHKNNKLNDLIGLEWIKFTKSWFIVNPKQRKNSEVLHPAKYPEELAERYIKYFTKEGQKVLDPFNGVGSTLIASKRTGRKGFGIEFSKKYYEISKKRLSEEDGYEQKIINGNSLNIDNILKSNDISEIELVLTSPPYWNMLGQSRGNVLSAHKKREKAGLDVVYSDKEGDLGNIDNYEEFLDRLTDVFIKMKPFIKHKGYLVIVLQNLRTKNGEMCTLAWDLTGKLKNKYKFVGEQLWLQDNKKLGIWGYPSTFVSNIHHHYCLIFKNEF